MTDTRKCSYVPIPFSFLRFTTIIIPRPPPPDHTATLSQVTDEQGQRVYQMTIFCVVKRLLKEWNIQATEFGLPQLPWSRKFCNFATNFVC